MLSTDKLKNKEVINISDGRSLGFVSDIEVNLEKGAIEGIIIPAERGLFSWFHKGEEDRMGKRQRTRDVGRLPGEEAGSGVIGRKLSEKS